MGIATNEYAVEMQRQSDERQYQEKLNASDNCDSLTTEKKKIDEACFLHAVKNADPATPAHLFSFITDERVLNGALYDIFFETLDSDHGRFDLLKVIVEAAKNGQKSALALLDNCANMFVRLNN